MIIITTMLGIALITSVLYDLIKWNYRYVNLEPIYKVNERVIVETTKGIPIGATIISSHNSRYAKAVVYLVKVNIDGHEELYVREDAIICTEKVFGEFPSLEELKYNEKDGK